MDKIIYGGDTETLEGEPLSMQFYSEDIACNDMFFCNAGNAASKFFAWLEKRKKNCQHVIYVHNLSFDLVEFLWGHHAKLVTSTGEYDFITSPLPFIHLRPVLVPALPELMPSSFNTFFINRSFTYLK